MKRKGCLVLMLLASMVLSAQSDFEKYVQQEKRAYQKFIDKRNADYAQFLQQSWEAYQAYQGQQPPQNPLPPKPQIYQPEQIQQGQESVKSDTAESLISRPLKQRLFEQDTAFLIQDTTQSFNNAIEPLNSPFINLNFYGVNLQIPYAENLKIKMVSNTERDFSEAWLRMSASNYKITLEKLQSEAQKMGLNDWGYYMLVKQFSENLYTDYFQNERVALQMYLLAQMQYKVRCARINKDLYLLCPFSEMVYYTPFLILDQDRYFIMGTNSTSEVYTFSKDFSSATKKMSLILDKSLKIGPTLEDAEVPQWKCRTDSLRPIPIHKNNMAFMLDYPLLDLENYHQCTVDEDFEKVIIQEVSNKIKDKNEIEALSYILDLVQNGFDYITDQELFGRQKPLFIEESFYYGMNNCKDRVLVFSWLVKKILHLPMVMLIYEGQNQEVGHASCAVALNSDFACDYYDYQGIKYIVTDPTFINAPVGMSMPQYKKKAAKIIPL